jgi:hypothetical protein
VENILIDDRCHQVCPQLQLDFSNGLLSIKMPCVVYLFTNLEIVSPDGHVVSGNLRRNVLLHDIYELVFT